MTIETFYYNFKNKAGLLEKISRLDPTKLWRIRIDEYDARTLEQNSKIHAILGDIATQTQHLTKTLDIDSWKRLCTAQFSADSIENNVSRISDYWLSNKMSLMPSLDGRTLVTLGSQTRIFPKYVAAGFITWLLAYAINNNIILSEPEQQFDERYSK